MRYSVTSKFSFIGSPTYNLSKLLVKIISPLLNYKYSLFNKINLLKTSKALGLIKIVE